MEKFLYGLRWVCVFPGILLGLFAGFCIGILFNLQIEAKVAGKLDGIILPGDMLGGMFPAAFAVCLAICLAPSHKKQVGLAASLFCLAASGFPHYFSNSWDLSREALIEWVVVFLGMAVGATVALEGCLRRAPR